MIDPHGFSYGDRTTYGRLEGIDALAVTNAKGEFRIGMDKDGKLHARVSASGFADSIARDLVTGRPNRIRLQRGTFVVGRVLKDGKPVPNIGLGLVQQNRSALTFLGDMTISTDEAGVFQFVNVPANERMFVYGLMDSCRTFGAIPQIEVSTGANNSTLKLGDLSFERGYAISGRVLLSDDRPVPPNTRVLVSRDGPWDSQQVLVAADGTFEITGVPAETCSLIARVKGYRPSARNQSLDLLNPFWSLRNSQCRH